MSFVHLHTHTEYSMLDGASRIRQLMAQAAADGQPAIAITDHGNMYGVLDFYKEAKKFDLNPIIGMEAYMAPQSRFDRPARRGKVDDTGGEGSRGEKLYYHLVLLAENETGYRNLIELSSKAFLEGYYYKPRLDWELLEAHHEGLIATSACLGGIVAQHLLKDEYEKALEAAGRLQDIFGKESFYIEIQDHGMAEQKRINPDLVRLAQHIGAPLVATNDSHYVKKEDHAAHDALLCIQTGSLLSDTNRFRFEGEEHYLKSAEEMRKLFSELPDACDNTLAIGERCQVEIEFGKANLPEIPIPDQFASDDYDKSATAYLQHLTITGAERRYEKPLPEPVRERIDYELSVIADMGFSGYFLVVWDLIHHAKTHGIRVGPGRGSAAGSVVAYCLEIVDLDPMRYDLIFERFLNPGRKQMPDIDMDFDERYRGEMIRYASERYGSDHVAQIITFSTIKARAAVRDAARVLGYPYSVGDKIAKAMPPLIMGRDTPLHACLELEPGFEDGYNMAQELREIIASDPDAKKVVEVATGLEGLRRQDGIHAAAVVITRDPLTEYLPIQRKPDPGQDPESAPIVTQYEMHGVEELGLLKMDFLGLRTLSVIDRALELIKQSRGEEIDISKIPLDDPKTYEMLQRADSLGVFQVEGAQMRSLMRSLRPTNFDDIAALIALYRPGPMAANMHNDYADRKNGRKPISYLHRDLEEILADTYGLMIYQESMMRVAQKFAGYSLAEADNLRKACGKKIRELLKAEREKFVAGCEKTGYGATLGEQLFDIIEPFADYAFNKSHSYGYGLISYQTAWLKANYPVQYLAALLTSVKDDKDKTALYLADAAAHGIEVLVPDVNHSLADFTVVKLDNDREGILFGLAAIRNVGDSIVSCIVKERERGGPFADFADFCLRLDQTALNRRTVESLIKAGAFDSLGHSRRGLYAIYERAIDTALDKRAERDRGLISLFEEPESTKPTMTLDIGEEEWAAHEKLSHEREMLGLYVSEHPLRGALDKLVALGATPVAEANEADEGPISVAGIAGNLTKRRTKKGESMASMTIEDTTGSIDVMIFPKVMSEVGEMLAPDGIYLVSGRLDRRDERPKIAAQKIVALDLDHLEVPDGTQVATPAKRPRRRRTYENAVVLEIVENGFVADKSYFLKLKELLESHPGDKRLIISLLASDQTSTDFEIPSAAISDRSLYGDLRATFGNSITIRQ
jgi:DNA polymerase-3 subunit alpha